MHRINTVKTNVRYSSDAHFELGLITIKTPQKMGVWML